MAHIKMAWHREDSRLAGEWVGSEAARALPSSVDAIFLPARSQRPAIRCQPLAIWQAGSIRAMVSGPGERPVRRVMLGRHQDIEHAAEHGGGLRLGNGLRIVGVFQHQTV